MVTVFCPRCRGCGKLANTEQQEPWIYWLELPIESQLAIALGVKPETCKKCKGTGTIERMLVD